MEIALIRARYFESENQLDDLGTCGSARRRTQSDAIEIRALDFGSDWRSGFDRRGAVHAPQEIG
jgi:hypothetical protein